MRIKLGYRRKIRDYIFHSTLGGYGLSSTIIGLLLIRTVNSDIQAY